MKKYVILLAFCALQVVGGYAQNEAQNRPTSDRPKVYLPEKGDLSIGINVAPVFGYLGNLFNGSSDNELEAVGGQPITNRMDGYEKDDIMPDVSIMGKYMLSDKWALKANIGLLMRTNINKRYVRDDEAYILDPLSEHKVIDKRKISRHGGSLMIGAEYRKGKRRVQGIFGAGLLLGVQSTKTAYSYGNEITHINQHPTSAWSATAPNGYRVLTSKTASDFFCGVSGSAGFEWFFAPKIALGAEVNLNLYYVMGGQEHTKSVGYNSSTESLETRYDLNAPGDDAFHFGTENLGGALYVSFYF